ncbi:MAG: M48 family metallopeptidase [Clostridiales bacterium]|jgi:predicted metal-dependent hydrolase|nr:M48 family metallopeptidase [Clostridiales bacterium]
MISEVKGIKYEIRKKRNVKNINIHVKPDGSVWASAPLGASAKEIDTFIAEKAEWIRQAQAKCKLQREERLSRNDDMFALSTTDCLFRFNPLADRAWALIRHRLKRRFPGGRPQIKVVDEKSRWGTCNPRQDYISLSHRLMRMPDKTVEMVILHEFCHYLESNHQAGFHGIMRELMPDYKEREKPLKGKR